MKSAASSDPIEIHVFNLCFSSCSHAGMASGVARTRALMLVETQEKPWCLFSYIFL